MQLIVLGSGTTVPSALRNAAGYYLAVHNQEFLIDCGSGVLVQLERTGKSYRTLDAVFITHTHPDHIGDFTVGETFGDVSQHLVLTRGQFGNGLLWPGILLGFHLAIRLAKYIFHQKPSQG